MICRSLRERFVSAVVFKVLPVRLRAVRGGPATAKKLAHAKEPASSRQMDTAAVRKGSRWRPAGPISGTRLESGRRMQFSRRNFRIALRAFVAASLVVILPALEHQIGH